MSEERADPRVPGSTRLREGAFAFLYGALMISLLGLVAHAAQAPFIFPSLGPTAFLVFYRPTASAASPRNSVVGHLIGVLCGVAAAAAFGQLHEPSALETGVTIGRALAAGLSLGATSGLMIWLRRGHPPAGATTLIVSLGLLTSVRELAVLMAAVLLLLGGAHVLHRLAGTRYPLWAPFADSSERPAQPGAASRR